MNALTSPSPARPLYGHRLRRFLDHTPAFEAVKSLAPWHPAATNGRTLYLARVAVADDRAPVLKGGQNNRKIGGRVVKGRWAGMPIYTLTLEERATCPRTCAHWLDCYGNKMNWSTRLLAGPELEERLDVELHELATRHPLGFVVRLHVLGDFYSPAYVRRWRRWLLEIPEMRVYGYTGWPRETPIGAAVAELAERHWERFAVRTSDRPGPRGTVSHDDPMCDPDAIVCPAQVGRAECCATCALCWQTQRSIAFLVH